MSVAENPHKPQNPDTDVRLSLKGICKSYGTVKAVKGIDLNVRKDDGIVTLLGPSGSGKTTLLQCVAGFITPDRGTITIDDRDITNLAPRFRDIGMVFQDYALFPHLTAARNIEYGLKIRSWDRKRREKRVDEMLKLVGLSDRGGHFPRQLSGGQKQRVAIARALAFNPTILLMDEPLGALDRALREEMAIEIRKITSAAGVTGLYVTHDRNEALTVSDRVAIVHDGVFDSVGAPEVLFERPPTVFTARFFGSHNVLEVKPVRRAAGDGGVAVDLFGTTTRVSCEPAVTSGLPRVHVSVPATAGRLDQTSPRDVPVEFVPVTKLYLGDRVQYRGQLAGTAEVTLSFALRGTSQFVLGSPSQIFLNTAELHAMP